MIKERGSVMSECVYPVKCPHEEVYARIGVSSISGVGVLAIRDIPAGTDIFGEMNSSEDDFVQVSEAEVEALQDESLKKLYHDFAVLEDGIYYCPESFNEMTPSFYLNHSDNPNCISVGAGLWFASKRDIKAGEELTVDYHSYSEKPEGEVV